MPSVTERTVTAYAHCPNPRCPGNEPTEVQAVRRVSEFTYLENGGELPGIERSTEHWRVADPLDENCSCGRLREISGGPRPEYAGVSGHRQDGLLHVKQFDPGQQAPVAPANDAVIAELMKQVAALTAKLNGAVEEPPPEPAVDDRAAEIRAARVAALEKARAVKAQRAQEGGHPE